MQPTQSTPDTDVPAATVASLVRAHRAGATLGELLDVPESHLEQAEAFGFRLYQRGDYHRAQEIARGLIALDERRLYPQLLLGEVLLKRSQDDETLRTEDAVDARAAFERVLKLDPSHHTAAIKLARLHLHTGCADRARPLLRTILDQSDDDALHSEAEVLLELADAA